MQRLSILLCVACGSAGLLAGPEHLIKQRAKDVRDQNNASQGVRPAPATPATGTTRPAGTTTYSAMPPQSALNRLTTDLTNLKTNTPVSQAQVQSFARNLASAAQGARKPTAGTVTKLANDLLPALAANPLSANSRTRLLQNCMALVNGNGTTPAQLSDVILDLQGLLQTAGTPAPTAKLITEDARAVAREVHPAFR